MTLPRQCEKQIGVRPTTKWNAVTIPVAVICPHNAVEDSPYCEKHQPRVVFTDGGDLSGKVTGYAPGHPNPTMHP